MAYVHRILVCAALLLLAAAPAQAGEEQRWGVMGYAAQAFDIDHVNLYEGGAVAHLDWCAWQGQALAVDIRLEAQGGRFWDYGVGTEFALSPGVRVFATPTRTGPFVEAGLGLSVNDLDTTEPGSWFNFASYGGLGLWLPLPGHGGLELGWRVRHLSNAGLDSEHNPGATFNLVYLGLSWIF